MENRFRQLRRLVFSLHTQLIIYYTVVSVGVLGLSAYFGSRYISQMFRQYNQRFLYQQLSQANYNLSRIYVSVNEMANLFIDDSSVQSFLQSNYKQPDFEVIQEYNSIVNRIDDFRATYGYIRSIYIYTDNGGAIGASEQYTLNNWGNVQNDSFFTSALHEAAREKFPQLMMDGGLRDSDYNANSLQGGSNRYVVSFAKGIKPVARPDLSATIVINIDESYMSSVYSNNFSYAGEYMYIVDGNGKIVSSENGKKLGTINSAFLHSKPTGQYGSFVSRVGGREVQIVYYRLSNTNWYLADEISLHYLSGDAYIVQKFILIIFVLSILIIFVTSFVWLGKITRPLRQLAVKMGEMGRGNFGLTMSNVPENELSFIVRRFNEMSLNMAKLMEENDRIQKDKINLEIAFLQAQISPHFIYNTLNMIKWMAVMIHACNIEESVVALGNLLQPVFQAHGQMWSVREEIAYIDNYLKIIGWRFGNSMSFHIEAPDKLKSLQILKFILQPIIENSVSHGKCADRPLRIDITVRQDENLLWIMVSDNGNGIETGKLDEMNQKLACGKSRTDAPASIGLLNVNQRIRLNFGETYGLHLQSVEGKSTTACVCLPVVEKSSGMPSVPDSGK